MRPDARVWRKSQRAAEKGIPVGRRATHQVKTQEPERGFGREQAWRRRRAGLPMWPLDTLDGA